MPDLAAEVRQLRERLGESQQAFATRVGLSIRAVANYEADRMPTAKVLGDLYRQAREAGYQDLAELFWRAMLGEMGVTEAIGRRINDATCAIHAAATELAILRSTRLSQEQRRIVERAEAKLSEACELDELDPYHTPTKGTKSK
jgi:transcriptional regulator with XRE-family HTH domain